MGKTYVAGFRGERIDIDLELVHRWSDVLVDIRNCFEGMDLDFDTEIRVQETIMQVVKRRAPHKNPEPRATIQPGESLQLQLQEFVIWHDVSEQIALAFPDIEPYGLAVSTEGGAIRFFAIKLRKSTLSQ